MLPLSIIIIIIHKVAFFFKHDEKECNCQCEAVYIIYIFERSGKFRGITSRVSKSLSGVTNNLFVLLLSNELINIQQNATVVIGNLISLQMKSLY